MKLESYLIAKSTYGDIAIVVIEDNSYIDYLTVGDFKNICNKMNKDPLTLLKQSNYINKDGNDILFFKSRKGAIKLTEVLEEYIIYCKLGGE